MLVQKHFMKIEPEQLVQLNTQTFDLISYKHSTALVTYVFKHIYVCAVFVFVKYIRCDLSEIVKKINQS